MNHIKEAKLKIKPSKLVAAALVCAMNSHAAIDDATTSAQAAASQHAAYRLDNWEQVVHKWRMLGSAGLRLKDLEVLEHGNGKRYYSAVWEPGNGKQALYRYSNWNAFVDKWRSLQSSGYRLVDIERVRHGNQFWYYGIWHAGSGKYALYKYSNWRDFTAKWSELNKAGQRLIDIDVSEHNGVTTYLGVWRQGAGKYALYNFSSWNKLVAKWKQLGAEGYQLADMDLVRLSNGSTRYVGVWRAASTGTKRALYHYTNWTSFKRKWAELADQGYALLDVEVSQRGANGLWYSGSFGPAPAAPSDAPDLGAMAQYLEDTMSDSVVGMSYAIGHNGQLALAGSTGKAQRAPDSDIAMTSHIRSTVASVSKAVTAPLLYQLLDANGLTIDSPVAPWLPAAWDNGPGFENNASGVTFRHLLTHTSGLNQAFTALKDAGQSGPWGNGWDGLQFVVENGTDPGSSRQYKNANFALMRILIPELWKAADGWNGSVSKANVGERYLAYMHALVLNREGIESVTCAPQIGYPEAKSYNFGDASLAGASNSSSPDGCGGHANLHFSAQELTRYAMSFRYNRSIMSTDDLGQMRNLRAGWSAANAVGDGTAYSHDGAWNRTGGRRTRTCMMELPNGVSASIIFNSMPPSSACGVLRQAYNEAL